MAGRKGHYEQAFEDYLRARGWPYVAVDERKKTLFAEASIKSFDFLVYSQTGPNLLVEVKGRRFPDNRGGRRRGGARAYENWVTQADLDGLVEWEKVFGADFEGVLVFAYRLDGPPQRADFEDVHLFRGAAYAFMGIALGDYLPAARPRSERWDTVSVPTRTFLARACDVQSFL
jgi:hypothetical protein